jgi:molybdate transport system regulatory protein
MARIRLGVYVDDDGPKIGRGKIQLLKAIRDEGSISAAARSMGMAYRHAWSMLDELNQCFDERVIVSSMGGRRGGGARLTPWGAELIERFEAMEKAATESVDAQLSALEAHVKAEPSPASDRRRR